MTEGLGYCIQCSKPTSAFQKGEYICDCCQLPDEPKYKFTMEVILTNKQYYKWAYHCPETLTILRSEEVVED